MSDVETLDPVLRRVLVTYDSDVFGSGILFDGYMEEHICLKNVAADKIAHQTAADGKPRTLGMWRSVEITN